MGFTVVSIVWSVFIVFGVTTLDCRRMDSLAGNLVRWWGDMRLRLIILEGNRPLSLVASLFTGVFEEVVSGDDDVSFCSWEEWGTTPRVTSLRTVVDVSLWASQ